MELGDFSKFAFDWGHALREIPRWAGRAYGLSRAGDVLINLGYPADKLVPRVAEDLTPGLAGMFRGKKMDMPPGAAEDMAAHLLKDPDFLKQFQRRRNVDELLKGLAGWRAGAAVSDLLQDVYRVPAKPPGVGKFDEILDAFREASLPRKAALTGGAAAAGIGTGYALAPSTSEKTAGLKEQILNALSPDPAKLVRREWGDWINSLKPWDLANPQTAKVFREELPSMMASPVVGGVAGGELGALFSDEIAGLAARGGIGGVPVGKDSTLEKVLNLVTPTGAGHVPPEWAWEYRRRKGREAIPIPSRMFSSTPQEAAMRDMGVFPVRHLAIPAGSATGAAAGLASSMTGAFRRARAAREARAIAESRLRNLALGAGATTALGAGLKMGRE
jgi:hypothetical protein